MASLGSSFIDKRQGKARLPKPPPPRRNRNNQAAAPNAPTTSSSAPGATDNATQAFSTNSTGALQQSNATPKDAALPQIHHERGVPASGQSTAAITERRRSASPTENPVIISTSASTLAQAAEQRPMPVLDDPQLPMPTATNLQQGAIRPSRTTRSQTFQSPEGHLPTPATSQDSTASTSTSPSRKRTHLQQYLENRQVNAGRADAQHVTEASEELAKEGPAKKARKIRSDKGRPRGPRANKTTTHQISHPGESAMEQGQPQQQAEARGLRATRAASKRGRSGASQLVEGDTIDANGQGVASFDDTDTQNGDEERPRKSRRRRASTPEEIKPDRLNSGDTMMFELGRDKKIGPVSNLEQAMRSIDWKEVRQKRYEADVREMEEDLARQAAMDAENDPDQGEAVTEPQDAEAENASSPIMNGSAKRKRGRRNPDEGDRIHKGRRSSTTSQDQSENSHQEDATDGPDAQPENPGDGEEEAGAEEHDTEGDSEVDALRHSESAASTVRPRNPRLRMVNGEIQFDNSSLTVDRQAETAAAAEEAAADDFDAIEENDLTNQINSRSFLADRRRDPRERFYMKHRQRGWTEEATAQFYEALRMFGTDFYRISKLFPGRTRNHIKRKFNREERANPTLIDEACLGGKPGGLAYFAEAVGRDVDSFKDPKAFMGQLEQEKSRQREAIEQEQREKQEEVERKRDAARQRQEQIKKDREERRRRKEEKRARQKGKNRPDNSVEEIVESAENQENDPAQDGEDQGVEATSNVEDNDEEVVEYAQDDEEEIVESAEDNADGTAQATANDAEDEDEDDAVDEDEDDRVGASDEEIIADYGDDYFDDEGGSDID